MNAKNGTFSPIWNIGTGLALLLGMNVILALSPQESDGLLELTLEAAGVRYEYFQRIKSSKQLAEMNLMILDPDQPGQDFLLRYRKLYAVVGAFPLIVLGPSTHITLKMIPWAVPKTTFLDGENVLKRLETLLAPKVAPAPHAERTIELFKGLKSIQLCDILQMLCLSRWTGEIRVHEQASGHIGKLALVGGEIHNAITADHNAENACYEMLAWKSCEFHFLEQARACARTMNAGWEAILMEAACRIDESAQTLVS